MKKQIIFLMIGIAFCGAGNSRASDYNITEFPICTDPSIAQYPLVSGNLVVWEDSRHRDQGLYSIYGYDLTTNTESLIYSNNAGIEDLSLGGNIIAWLDRRNATIDVYGYNLQTQTVFPIATGDGTQYSPNVSSDGSMVVWEGVLMGEDYGIYRYDVASQTTYAVSTDAVVNDTFTPVIDGDVVVWRDYRNGNYDIYGYNIDTEEELTITTATGDQFGPRISGDIVVWDDNRNGLSESDVFGYDLAAQSEFQVLSGGTAARLDIDENIVVWMDVRNAGTGNDWDIYGYDLSTDTEFPICLDSAKQRDAAVSGNYVAWLDTRNGEWDVNRDIYGATIPEPTSIFILSLSTLVLFLTRKKMI